MYTERNLVCNYNNCGFYASSHLYIKYICTVIIVRQNIVSLSHMQLVPATQQDTSNPLGFYKISESSSWYLTHVNQQIESVISYEVEPLADSVFFAHGSSKVKHGDFPDRSFLGCSGICGKAQS